MQCEFHFQEGFTGETVTLSVDGEVRAQFEARTRLQTGLARIESLELTPGQTVAIAVSAPGLGAKHRAAAGDRWITVNRVDGTLVVQSATRRPGYV